MYLYFLNFIMLKTFLQSFQIYFPIFRELDFKIRILQISIYNDTKQNPPKLSFINNSKKKTQLKAGTVSKSIRS